MCCFVVHRYLNLTYSKNLEQYITEIATLQLQQLYTNLIVA